MTQGHEYQEMGVFIDACHIAYDLTTLWIFWKFTIFTMLFHKILIELFAQVVFPLLSLLFVSQSWISHLIWNETPRKTANQDRDKGLFICTSAFIAFASYLDRELWWKSKVLSRKYTIGNILYSFHYVNSNVYLLQYW